MPCSPASRRSAGTPSSRARRAAPSTLGARCLKCRDTRTPQKARARRLRGHQQSPALLTQRAAPQPVRSQAARAALPTRRLASPMLTVTSEPPGDVADESQLFQVFYNTLFSKRREVDFKSGRMTTTILSQLLNRSDFSPENSVPHVSNRFGMGTPQTFTDKEALAVNCEHAACERAAREVLGTRTRSTLAHMRTLTDVHVRTGLC